MKHIATVNRLTPDLAHTYTFNTHVYLEREIKSKI